MKQHNNVIRLNRDELKALIAETVSHVLGVLNDRTLNEMALIGNINGKYQVIVRMNDPGFIPHVHVQDRNSNGLKFDTCIMLEDNAYFIHGHHDDKLNSAMRKEFNDFMHAPEESGAFENNYASAVHEWNKNNSSRKIELKTDEYGHVIVPDYTQIKEL